MTMRSVGGVVKHSTGSAQQIRGKCGYNDFLVVREIDIFEELKNMPCTYVKHEYSLEML